MFKAFDRMSGDTRYCVGGAPFTGDLSLFAGGTLENSTRQASATSQFDAVDVILVGADRSTGFDFPIDQNLGDWTDYSLSLATATGWFGPATGPAAPNTEITAVLAALDFIEIHGEYRVGADTAGLDDFALIGVRGCLSRHGEGPDTPTGTTGGPAIWRWRRGHRHRPPLRRSGQLHASVHA